MGFIHGEISREEIFAISYHVMYETKNQLQIFNTLNYWVYHNILE